MPPPSSLEKKQQVISLISTHPYLLVSGRFVSIVRLVVGRHCGPQLLFDLQHIWFKLLSPEPPTLTIPERFVVADFAPPTGILPLGWWLFPAGLLVLWRCRPRCPSRLGDRWLIRWFSCRLWYPNGNGATTWKITISYFENDVAN